MTTILISGLAIACLLTAVETFFKPLGKWRGLLSLVLSTVCCITFEVELRLIAIYIFATLFTGLTLSIMVDQLFVGTSTRDFRSLPNRIPSR